MVGVRGLDFLWLFSRIAPCLEDFVLTKCGAAQIVNTKILMMKIQPLREFQKGY